MQVTQLRKRYTVGLEKLFAAEHEVNIMKTELIALQPKLIETGTCRRVCVTRGSRQLAGVWLLGMVSVGKLAAAAMPNAFLQGLLEQIETGASSLSGSRKTADGQQLWDVLGMDGFWVLAGCPMAYPMTPCQPKDACEVKSAWPQGGNAVHVIDNSYQDQRGVVW